MKFEYCAITYNLDTNWGDFSVYPSSHSELSKEKAGITDALKRLGEDGWELVSSTPINIKSGARLYLIFKKVKSA